MSNPTLEGMARTFFEELDKVTAEEAMSAAILWLADNVSDEMFDAFYAVERMAGTEVRPDWKKRFAAALRAASSEGEAT